MKLNLQTFSSIKNEYLSIKAKQKESEDVYSKFESNHNEIIEEISEELDYSQSNMVSESY